MKFPNFFIWSMEINYIVAEICNWSAWSENPVCFSEASFCNKGYIRKCRCVGKIYSLENCDVHFHKYYQSGLLGYDNLCKVHDCLQIKSWCPWMYWSSWSSSCNRGRRTRTRKCCNALSISSHVRSSSILGLYSNCLTNFDNPTSYTDTEYREEPCRIWINGNNGTSSIITKTKHLRYTLIPIFAIGISIFFLLYAIRKFCYNLRTRNSLLPIMDRNDPRRLRNPTIQSSGVDNRITSLPLITNNNPSANETSTERIADLQNQRYFDSPPSYDSLNIETNSSLLLPPPSYKSCTNIAE